MASVIAQATDITADTDTTICTHAAVYYGMSSRASGVATDGVVVRTSSQTGAVIDRILHTAAGKDYHAFPNGIHCPRGIYVQTDALSTGTTIYWSA